MKNTDRLFLGDNAVFEADPKRSGINSNVLVVGGTGSGKSLSVATPIVINNKCQSMIIPIAKRQLLKSCKPILEKHGYDIHVIDLADGSMSTDGFNPLMYLDTDEDCISLAQMLKGSCRNDYDPYWENTAADAISAMLYLILLNSMITGETPQWTALKDFYQSIRITKKKGLLKGDLYETNLDCLFDKANELLPGNYASIAWKSLSGLPDRTFSCAYGLINVALNGLFNDSIVRSTTLPSLNIHDIGRKKTALFILTSPGNTSNKMFVNLLYSMIIKTLMKDAESGETGRLKVPVQIIFDDFACGTRIDRFEEYISVFRSAGISTVILLQSEQQLYDIYDSYAANTIIDNCDYYVYLGGNCYNTSYHISQMINKPVSSVLNLKMNSVIIMRRGHDFIITDRYKIFEDPLCPSILRRI